MHESVKVSGDLETEINKGAAEILPEREVYVFDFNVNTYKNSF